MRVKKGINYYESGDEIVRLEVRKKQSEIPRLVAILKLAKREIAAEIRHNLNRCGTEGGEPITQAFEGFLRHHNLIQPEKPLLAGRKNNVVAYVRRPAF